MNGSRLIFGVQLLGALLLLREAGNAAAEIAKRKIPCKTPTNASSCYWTHGRLGLYNGTPA